MIAGIVPHSSERYQDVFYPRPGKRLSLVLSFFPPQDADKFLDFYPADLIEGLVLEIGKEPIVNNLLVVVPFCPLREVAPDILIPFLNIGAEKDVPRFRGVLPPLQLCKMGLLIFGCARESLGKDQLAFILSFYDTVQPGPYLLAVCRSIVQPSSFLDSPLEVVEKDVELPRAGFSDDSPLFPLLIIKEH